MWPKHLGDRVYNINCQTRSFWIEVIKQFEAPGCVLKSFGIYSPFTQLMTFQYFQLCLSYGMVLVLLPISCIPRCSRRISFLSRIHPSSPSTQSFWVCFSAIVFLLCLELNHEIPFADNLFNKQNCNNRFRCHLACLRMFATTRKQTNSSCFSLKPPFPMTSNFLPWGNIWSFGQVFFRLWHKHSHQHCRRQLIMLLST